GFRRSPAARWPAEVGASVSRFRSYQSARFVRGGRGLPDAASRQSPRALQGPGEWPVTPSPLWLSSAWSYSPEAGGGRSRRGHKPLGDSPHTDGRERPVPLGRVAPTPPATVPCATCHRRARPRHAGRPPLSAPARPTPGSPLLGLGAGDR